MTAADPKQTLLEEELFMLGMGFLRLRKVLKEHRWTPSRGHEEIDAARKKEDRLFWAGVTIFFVLLLIAVIAGVR